MPNMKAIIQSHNKSILASSKNDEEKTCKLCNCRIKDECPLAGKCKTSNVVYEASIEANNNIKKYIGSTGNDFKQ